MIQSRTVLSTLALLLFTLPGLAGELRSTLEDQVGMAVTIYNQNLALVKDRRTITLDRGEQQLDFRDVSAQMRPETALLRNVDKPDSLHIVEQNFNFDLLTPDKLLQKYTGREVKVARTNPATGQETIEPATVLSTNNGVVLQFSDRIETQLQGRLIFEDVPDNLRDKPTLSILLDNQAPGAQDVELSYLTGGLSWKADYVAELNDDDSHLDLLGWVTLTNQSGATYRDATMQLVAGNVNRVTPRRARALRDAQIEEVMVRRAKQMSEESLFEYHLYTLGRPTTIADQQTKQVSLLSAARVPVTKELVLWGEPHYYRGEYHGESVRRNPAVFVQFKNEESEGLGMPLPGGVVRVYKRDSAGNAQFIGEDAINHTPRKERVRLKLGESFDVTTRAKQTDYRIVERLAGDITVTEASYEIELRNARANAVTVIVREPIPGDWEILRETVKHDKVASGLAQWRVTVPAEGATTLKFTTRIRM